MTKLVVLIGKKVFFGAKAIGFLESGVVIFGASVLDVLQDSVVLGGVKIDHVMSNDVGNGDDKRAEIKEKEGDRNKDEGN